MVLVEFSHLATTRRIPCYFFLMKKEIFRGLMRETKPLYHCQEHWIFFKKEMKLPHNIYFLSPKTVQVKDTVTEWSGFQF